MQIHFFFKMLILHLIHVQSKMHLASFLLYLTLSHALFQVSEAVFTFSNSQKIYSNIKVTEIYVTLHIIKIILSSVDFWSKTERTVTRLYFATDSLEVDFHLGGSFSNSYL
jgi:hypothetical protein